MECIELQSDIQLEEKFIQVFLLYFYKLHLSKEKHSALCEHVLFIMSFLPSIYICEQTYQTHKK